MARCLNCIHFDVCDTDKRGCEKSWGDCSDFLNDNDVVPRSEVEKLQNDLVIWKQNRFNLYQKLECYEMARQTVAREIFAEIEFEIANLDFDRDETRAIAIEGIIANAKKKYTDGKST